MADTSERRVVWVLGAGFSKALGGPLLPELLTEKSVGDNMVRYRKDEFPRLHDDEATTTRTLYWYGLANRPGAEEALWANAEDFIDYVDTAAEPQGPGDPNPHADRLSRIVASGRFGMKATPPELLRSAARRLIAAECCAFLEGVDPKRESSGVRSEPGQPL